MMLCVKKKEILLKNEKNKNEFMTQLIKIIRTEKKTTTDKSDLQLVSENSKHKIKRVFFN